MTRGQKIELSNLKQVFIIIPLNFFTYQGIFFQIFANPPPLHIGTQPNIKTFKKFIKIVLELESAIKRTSSRGVTDRLYSPYNKGGNTTPGGRRANSVPIKSYSPGARNTNTTT